MPKQLLKILKNGLLPVLLGCGLFFINIRDSHDWGDDFAQYLQEAQNLREGKPLASGSYIPNPEFFSIGPRVYPPGFPLLLAAATPLAQNEIIAGQILITALLIFAGWLMHQLLVQNKVRWPIASLLALTYLYHPWVLQQKAELLSDIPFTNFTLLAFYLLQKREAKWRWLWAGLAAGMAISIRSAGWVFPIAAIACGVLLLIQTKPAKKYFAFALVTAIAAILINGISGYMGNSAGYQSFIDMATTQLLPSIANHLDHYYHTFHAFVNGDKHWWPVHTILQLLLVLGLIRALIHFGKFQLPLFYILGYILLIVLFPITAGFRFLLPVIPLLLVAATSAFPRLFKFQSLLALLLLIWLNVSYQPQRQYILQQQTHTVEGPQSPEAVEVQKFIRSNLNEGDTLVFSKPRALAYYTGIPTTSTLWEIDKNNFAFQTRQLGATHYLYYTGIEYYALNDFVETNFGNLQVVFRNSKFTLYKKASAQVR